MGGCYVFVCCLYELIRYHVLMLHHIFSFFPSSQGKGTEIITHYPRAKLAYLDIPNIHAVRESYDALKSLCLSSTSGKWLSSLEGTQWINYISLLIKVLMWVWSVGVASVGLVT